MKELKIKFSLKSSFSTPFYADTIFASLCWTFKYIKGEEFLTDFLASYKENPPLLLSDAFPYIEKEGETVYYVPMPNLPQSSKIRESVRKAWGLEDNSKLKEFANLYKKISKTKFIPEDILTEKLTLDTILIYLKEHSAKFETFNYNVTHNVINRYSNTSNNVFESSETDINYNLYFYLKYDENKICLEDIKQGLKYIEITGYGKDASIGKGQIEIIDYIETEEEPKTKNNFLNLSSAYVPNKGDIDEYCYYNVHLKKGKLGGDYVNKYSPFKRPVLMIKAGAIIKGQSNKVYGCLVRNIHYENPDIVQYGYAYPLGVEL